MAKKKIKRERITIQDLERMSGSKYVTTDTIKFIDPIFGDEEEHEIELDIFDGFGYCADYKGKEYCLSFPKKKFIESFKDMEKAVRGYLSLDDNEPITETHILQAYSTFREI